MKQERNGTCSINLHGRQNGKSSGVASITQITLNIQRCETFAFADDEIYLNVIHRKMYSRWKKINHSGLCGRWAEIEIYVEMYSIAYIHVFNRLT